VYNILIVDDEKIERNGIKFLLKHLEIECSISEATNGLQALEHLKNNPVDIMLTDVKMPFLDGIGLIQQAVKVKSDLNMVIFSGYSEFEYARMAVKLGVSDYILKPVDPKEFETVIRKLIDKLNAEKKEDDLKETSMHHMMDHILYLLVNGHSYEELDKEFSKVMNISFLDCYSAMMLVEFNSNFFDKVSSDIVDEMYGLLGESVQYLNLNPEQGLLLFEKTENVNLLEEAKKIHTFFLDKYKACCCISIVEDIESANDIAKGFERAEELMENKFYQEQVFVFSEHTKGQDGVLSSVDDDTIMKQMKQDIKLKDISSLQIHFDIICQKYKNNKQFSQIYIKFIFSNLLKDFYEGIPNSKVSDLDTEIDRLYRATDFQTVIDIVSSNIKKLEEAFHQNPQMFHREIESVKRYIFENYDKELGVEQLADMVSMAPSYLSHIFKKETGQNLSKFIKAYRMEEAKKMLENTHNKIVNISNAVGYSNVSYFCQSFREYFGVSPQKFRNQGEINETVPEKNSK